MDLEDHAAGKVANDCIWMSGGIVKIGKALVVASVPLDCPAARAPRTMNVVASKARA